MVGMIGIAPTRITPLVSKTSAAAVTPHAQNWHIKSVLPRRHRDLEFQFRAGG